MDGIKTEESWNKTRIFIACFLITLLAAGAYFFKTRFLDQNLSPKEAKSVKGVSLGEKNKDKEENLGEGIREAVRDKLDDLKQDIFGLDIAEIASSSPQIQKIIKDMQSLQQYPTNQVKEICKEIYQTVCGL